MSSQSTVPIVFNKFDKISPAIPEIAGDIKRNIDQQVNSLAQEGLNQIGLGEVAGFAKKATDGSFFCHAPKISTQICLQNRIIGHYKSRPH